MRYTEPWTWTKGVRYYSSGVDGWSNSRDGIIIRFPKTYLHNWMKDYRKRVQAIETDEQAAHAIQTYWRNVIRDWNEHLKTEGDK